MLMLSEYYVVQNQEFDKTCKKQVSNTGTVRSIRIVFSGQPDTRYPVPIFPVSAKDALRDPEQNGLFMCPSLLYKVRHKTMSVCE